MTNLGLAESFKNDEPARPDQTRPGLPRPDRNANFSESTKDRDVKF